MVREEGGEDVGAWGPEVARAEVSTKMIRPCLRRSPSACGSAPEDAPQVPPAERQTMRGKILGRRGGPSRLGARGRPIGGRPGAAPSEERGSFGTGHPALGLWAASAPMCARMPTLRGPDRSVGPVRDQLPCENQRWLCRPSSSQAGEFRHRRPSDPLRTSGLPRGAPRSTSPREFSGADPR